MERGFEASIQENVAQRCIPVVDKVKEGQKIRTRNRLVVVFFGPRPASLLGHGKR